MAAPTKPLVGMAPALYWSAGAETYEVDDPRFYGHLASATGNKVIFAYDFDPVSYVFDRSTGDVAFNMLTIKPRVINPGAPLIITQPVYLYVADTSHPHLLRDDQFSPQQDGFSLYDYGGDQYTGILLTPAGKAAPVWQRQDEGTFLTVGEFVAAAVLVWGGAFAVSAVAGAAGYGAVAVETEVGASVVSGSAAGGELIASDFAGASALGSSGVGGTAAAAEFMGPVAPAVASGAGAAGATTTFSLADVIGAAKGATAVAGAVSQFQKAITSAVEAPIPPAPKSSPLPPKDDTQMLALIAALFLAVRA